jgi:hypothetical protein
MLLVAGSGVMFLMTYPPVIKDGNGTATIDG